MKINIKNKNIKLALITSGVVVAIATPAIIVGSIYGYNTNKVSETEKDLISFFDREEASLFQKGNFSISAPETQNGKVLVDNLTIRNVNFLKKVQLNNYSYNIKITGLNLSSQHGKFTFNYEVSSIVYPDIKISKTSESYSHYEDAAGVLRLFDKIS
jgi:hypothetical protein